MSEAVVADVVRVTARGTAGDIDLVVPRAAAVADVVRAYAQAIGAAEVRGLVTTTGRRLLSEHSVRASGLSDGDVVVADEPTGPPDASALGVRRAGVMADAGGACSAYRHVLGWAAAAVAVGAALVGAAAAPGALRTLCAGLLLLGAATAVQPWRDPARRRVAHALAPVFAAAGVMAGLGHSRPGGMLLVLVVAALAAAVAAAVSRARGGRDDERAWVWIAAASVAGSVTMLVLLLQASLVALWALLFTVALMVMRWLPYLVVDVPDQALLDIDRLAVTAWSARERPRSGRRRNVVDPAWVGAVAGRGSRLAAATVVASCLVLAVSGPLLALGAGAGVGGAAAYLLALFGGAAVTLTSRTYRSAAPRLLLRLGGGWVLAAVGVVYVAGLDAGAAWGLAAGGAVLGMCALVAAVALGRGWRSLWWARAGDVVEGSCVVLAIAALPVAAGLFDFVRELPS